MAAMTTASTTYTFGAFADGGNAVDDVGNIVEVTGEGTATYKAAAGVHSTAS